MFKRWSSAQKMFGLVVLGGAGFLAYRLIKTTAQTTTAGHMSGFLNPHQPDARHLAGSAAFHQIVSPFNPHQPEAWRLQAGHIAGAQLPRAGQQARGPMQHIQSPLHPHFSPNNRPAGWYR